MPATTTPIAPAAAAPKQATKLTTAQRLRIRSLLDKHFDDEAGCYLDGYSDQRIGAEVDVPWALVTKVREAAYGPIRVDPEIAALRAEIAQARRQVEALNAIVTALQARLTDIEKKRGAA
jgi:hypothetical protein